jgi:hypothetical protein
MDPIFLRSVHPPFGTIELLNTLEVLVLLLTKRDKMAVAG